MIRGDAQRNLIFDVGLHTGGDTAYYLRKGYSVLAIEADQRLAGRARKRFAPEIADGRLTVLNVGIAEANGTSTFWICDAKSDWNSFHCRVAGRRGSAHHAIEIPTRSFGEVLDQFGTPYYLKIDIEGNDHLCVRALVGRPLPRFISLETECLGDEVRLTEEGSLQTLDLLTEAGYRKFKLIFQRDFSSVTRDRTHSLHHTQAFAAGNSGPWGDDTPGDWLDYGQARQALFAAVASGVESWHDWHATL